MECAALVRAVRSDGFEVPIGDNVSGGNAWQTDRTFVESGHRPISENNLHLLDFGGTGEYTLFYAPIDTVGPVVTSVSGPASVISTPDLGAVARAFGGRGHLARTVEEVKKATAEWVAKPGPMIIDVRVSRSVITLPYRRIHYGEDE